MKNHISNYRKRRNKIPFFILRYPQFDEKTRRDCMDMMESILRGGIGADGQLVITIPDNIEVVFPRENKKKLRIINSK